MTETRCYISDFKEHWTHYSKSVEANQ